MPGAARGAGRETAIDPTARPATAPRWDVDTAARLFWAVTSQRVWDDLVVEQGWSDDQYREHLTGLLEAALLR